MSVQVAQKQNSGQALIETKYIEDDKKPQESGGYTPGPMFGFDQTIEYGGKTFNIAELAEADVQRQYGEMLGPSEDEVKAKFNQIMSATTQQEISAAGVDMKIGDTFITPNYLDSIRGTAKEAALFKEYKDSQMREQVTEFQTAVPFSGPKYQEVVLPQSLLDLPDEILEPVVSAVKNRQNLARLFKDDRDNPLNYLGREIIIDSFKTGDLGKAASDAFKAIPADAARLPTFVAMVANGLYASVAARETDQPGGMDTTYTDRFKEIFQENMRGWARTIQGYEGALNKYPILDDATSTMNRWYKKSFIERYGQELWDAAHLQPSYDIVNPEDDNYDEAIARQENGVGKPYVDVVRDENGDVVMQEVGLTPDLVSDLMDLAYNELSGTEQAAVFAATQLPLTLGLTARAVRRGNSMVREVNAAREQDPAKYATKSDWEVWTDISAQASASGVNILRNRFVQFVLGAGTLGTFGFKGKSAMHRGTMVNQHLKNLENFEDQISTYETDIKLDTDIANSRTSTPEEVTAAQERIKANRDSLRAVKASARAYKLRSGGSKRFASFNNPYVRSNLADDLIISAAVGYVPQVLSWDKIGMNQDTAQTLTMFTTPIVAPLLARGTVFTAASLGRKFTSGITQDIASTLQHASFIPYITTGIIARGDEAELRRVMAENDVPITDRNVEAFKTLSQVYQSMKPEYQIRMTQSLERYNNMMNRAEATMRNLKTKDGTPALTEDEILENMGTLHLSLAHATGIAPLIAIQARNGRQLSADDLRNAGKFDALMASLAAEEENYKGLNTLLSTLQKSLVEKSGIDMDSNEPLQNMLVELQELAVDGIGRLNIKKQQVDALVTGYMDELGEVDEDTLKRLVRMRSILTGADIRDPVEQTRITVETSIRILENGRLQAAALERFRNTLSESDLLQNANQIADRIFDITKGVRKSKVSEGYNDVRVYASDNDIVIDLSTLAQNLSDRTDEYKGQDFLYFMAGAKTFFNTGAGQAAKDAFESAARRGLLREWGDELEFVRAKQLELDPSAKVATDMDLALYLMNKARKNKRQEINYFQASVEEAEYVYRAFRDHQASARNQTVSDLDGAFKNEVDQAYAAADPSGELLTLARKARELHETLIGETSDRGRYAGNVEYGRKRRDVKSADPKEGRHFYPIPEDRPLAPFEQIARLAKKAVEEKDEVLRAEILADIEYQKDRIMYWYGAGYMSDGSTKGYGFDLSQRKQRVVADTMQSLLQTLIGKEVADADQRRLNNALDITKPVAGAGPGAMTKSEVVRRLRSDEEYDFERAARILEVEQAISVVTRSGDEGELIVRHLALNDVHDWSITLDALLEYDSVTRQAYRDNRKAIMSNESTLRQAAQQEVDQLANTLKIMGSYEALVSNPLQFFNTVFENATPKSINDLVKKFTDQNMDEGQVRAALGYMYMRGLEIKSGKKTELVAGDATQVVGDVSVLIDYVETKRHAAVMKAVLGEEHYQQMKGIASWADFAMGNGMGFRAMPDLAGMSVESVFSRVFNLARGMVSPIYVATEVSVRQLMMRNQSLISVALSDRTVARIMDKMLNRPKEVTRKDLQLFGLRINNYLAAEIIRNGGAVPSLEEALGEEVGKGQADRVRDLEAEDEAELQKRIEALDPAETI
jgi:hypothetical protein